MDFPVLSFHLDFPQGDRFIPNRPSMNFDLCNHMLLSNDNSENEPQPGADAPAPLHREFQQALRNTLLSPAGGGGGSGFKSDRGGDGGSAAGGSPRVLSFAERPPPPQDRYTNVLKVGSACCAGGVRACLGSGDVVGVEVSFFGGDSHGNVVLYGIVGRWLQQVSGTNILSAGWWGLILGLEHSAAIGTPS